MDREKLVHQYFNEREKTTVEYYRYLTKPREYIPGLTLYMSELELLNAIRDSEVPAISDLAQKLSITHGAVSQTVTRLMKKGLVIREQNGNDRRFNNVSLTELGVQVSDIDKHIKNLLKQEVSRISAHLTEKDILMIMDSDRAMRKVLSVYDDIIKDIHKK